MCAAVQYVTHFPKLEPYVSLLVDPEDPEDRARVYRDRTRLRALVHERVAAEAAEVSARGVSGGAAEAPPAAGAKRKRAAKAGSASASSEDDSPGRRGCDEAVGAGVLMPVAAALTQGMKRPRGASNSDVLARAAASAVSGGNGGAARAPAAAPPAAHDSDDELFAGAQRRRTSHAGDAAKRPPSMEAGGAVDSGEAASDEFFAVEGEDQRGGGAVATSVCAQIGHDDAAVGRQREQSRGSNHVVDDGVTRGGQGARQTGAASQHGGAHKRLGDSSSSGRPNQHSSGAKRRVGADARPGQREEKWRTRDPRAPASGDRAPHASGNAPSGSQRRVVAQPAAAASSAGRGAAAAGKADAEKKLPLRTRSEGGRKRRKKG